MKSWIEPLICRACVALLSLTALAGHCAAPVRVATTELPPYAMEREQAGPGALVEVVQELMRRTQTNGNIEFVPWRRAQLMTTTLPRVAIFPLTRSSEREDRYRWLARLYHEQFVFLSIEGRQFDVAAPQRHKQRRIGMLRGSVMIAAVREAGYVNIVESASVDEGMRFLKRGIVDAVFGDRAIFQQSIKARMPDRYVMSAPMRSTTTWLGGSLDFSDADVAAFGKAMNAMVDDGTYARILKKYALQAPP